MASATTPHLKLLECFSTATVPKTHFTIPHSKPSRLSLSLRHIHFSLSSISRKSKILPLKVVPFVSDSAQQEVEEGETELDNENGDVVEASATDPLAWEGKEGSDGDSFAESAEPPEEAKLFVGNLPYDYDSEKLAQLFYQAGVVEISEVIYNRQTDQSRGFGFVTMSTVEEAEKAVEMFSGYDIDGRRLTVNKAAPRGSQPERVIRTYEPSFRMYVGNLPWQVDNAKLEQVFSEHGKVVDARVVYDRENGRSRGFGFVTMSSEAELNDAIAALDGQNLDGRAIRVNVAEQKPRRSTF